MIVSTLGLEEEYRNLLKEHLSNRTIIHDKLSNLDAHTLAKVEMIFTYGHDITSQTVESMNNLRWIHIGQSGMDSLPFELLHGRNMIVTNSRGINSITIAEYVMCMMLNIVRNNTAFYKAAQNGIWDELTHLDELAEKTIGIMGLGMVGKEIAKRANAFDMNVLGLNIEQTPVKHVKHIFLPKERQEFLKQCDFVVVCMPLTGETQHMISATELAWMKETAYLINVGRGAIVKTEDLLDSLNLGKIAGAVLDVFEQEPLPADHPLWKMKNVVITPHIAGDRQASYMPKMMNILCSNLENFPDKQKMINCVDLRQGF